MKIFFKKVFFSKKKDTVKRSNINNVINIVKALIILFILCFYVNEISFYANKIPFCD